MENNNNQNDNNKQIISKEEQEKNNDNINIIENNNIKNKVDKSSQKEHKEGETNINETIKPKENDNNNIEKKKKIKYRINFSVLINNLRNISDKDESRNEIEFKSNVLLMSSQIYQSNKISVLTLLSFINYKKNNALYTYYINKKIFKYLQSQKGIESFIYIRTLYRAADFLKRSNNYFYAYKYIDEAYSLKQSSKIDNDSRNLLTNLRNEIISKINDYIHRCTKTFRDIEKESNLNDSDYNKLKELIKNLIDNKYQIKSELTPKNEDDYLYLINKKWVEKAKNFVDDYIKVRESKKKNEYSDYFKLAFNIDYVVNGYLNKIDPNAKEETFKYNPLPCLIDNYSICDWTDNWNDPLNEDENYFLQSNLEYMKDYYLLEKSDFDFLKKIFGVTNIIKRKKDCLNFFFIKSIIFDSRLKNKNYNFYLRNRTFQVRKNYTILDFKEKILRCLEDAFKQNLNDEKCDDKKKSQNLNEDKNNENNLDSTEDSKDKKIEKYNIYFYLLEKEKKDILIEMCISFVNEISSYDSLYIQKIDISDEENISNLFSHYDKKKNILIIEIQKDNEPLFLNEINNKYFCSECKKEISSFENIYKCNFCHFSVFCSFECSEKNKNHKKLDKIYLRDYLVEEFNLKKFLKKDIRNYFKPDQAKGMVGLSNLGNTCYMNSSLQCLSNTLDLTKYFLLKYYLNDINRGNRLGSNGTIASKYYELIEKMWYGTETKIAPDEFIEKFHNFKRQFARYRQQDAQEFLSILLDQLHEDLNRISNKPYIELLEKQPDEDDISASKRWWDLHKKREDSIIIDLFNGQLKSETICQVCKKSSITYDPFMFLCLPLPKIKSFLTIKIIRGTECKTFDFECFDSCTIIDLKNKAMEAYIKDSKIESKQALKLFDLETVIITENKTALEVISTDVKDKDYKGQYLLRKVLHSNLEVIFYEKKVNKNEKEDFKVFVFPIKEQKPIMNDFGGRRLNELNIDTYPLYFQISTKETIKDLYHKIYARFKALNYYEQKSLEEYKSKNQSIKILDLNIMHGKDTKKEGFLAMFYTDDFCKYCGQSNVKNFYCSILKYKTISEVFKNIKKPIILLATSECYNPNESRQLITNSLKEMSQDNNISLNDALDLFGKNNILQDDDMWYCSKCQKHQVANQKLKIYKAPKYLIVQLKRFNVKKSYDGNSNFTGEKNNTFVNYPVKDLDLTKYIVGPDKSNSKYDLYGVIQHFGSLNGGHYTAMCKNQDNWVDYNDSRIDFVKGNNPISQNAYILFYRSNDLDNISDDENEINEINEKENEKNTLENINDNYIGFP